MEKNQIIALTLAALMLSSGVAMGISVL